MGAMTDVDQSASERPELNVEQIRVDNLREALRLLQRCIVTALATSLSLLLLEFASSPSGVQQPAIQIPGLLVGVGASAAKLILFAAYSISGFVAFAAILHIKHIARSIVNNEVRDAALAFPTVTTMTDRGLAQVGILFPTLLFVITAIHYVHGIWPVDTDESGPAIGALLLGVMPYVGVVMQWRIGLGQDRKAHAPEVPPTESG
jgi:hypothetical protein